MLQLSCKLCESELNPRWVIVFLVDTNYVFKEHQMADNLAHMQYHLKTYNVVVSRMFGESRDHFTKEWVGFQSEQAFTYTTCNWLLQ